jgi:NAD(P)-dependent dehydrogenase (short-subunit alcohol dehydrogenase family)
MLALVDVTQPSAELQRDFGGAGHMLLGGADLADVDATRKAMASIAMSFGGIDVLVNVAGGFRWEKIEDGDIDTWDSLYSMNLRSAVVASKCALPAMLERGGGRIVNIGAGAAGKAALGMGAYAASKAGVQRFTEALAEELKDRNITVNAILPGIIDTPRNRLDMPKADFTRWVSPEAIAQVILFRHPRSRYWRSHSRLRARLTPQPATRGCAGSRIRFRGCSPNRAVTSRPPRSAQ